MDHLPVGHPPGEATMNTYLSARALSRVSVRRAGERLAGEGSVLGGGEQGERIPARAPGVPGFRARLQHHEPQVQTGQVPGHGQAGLTAADYDHVQELVAGPASAPELPSHGREL